MTTHTPHPFVLADSTGGIRCTCGWEERTVRRSGPRKRDGVTMTKVWTRYRRHWLDANRVIFNDPPGAD